MADEGYLIENLPTAQPTYDADLYVPVSKAGLTQARKMLLSVLNPKPSSLTAITEPFNAETVVLTADDGSGNLSKITPRQIFPVPPSLTAEGVPDGTFTTYLYNPNDSVLRRISLSNLGAGLKAIENFVSSDDFVEVNLQALVELSTTFGYITFQKIGNQVTGVIKENSVTGSHVAVYVLPSNCRPQFPVACLGYDNVNYAYFDSTGGTITVVFGTTSGYANIPFSFLTSLG